MERGDCISRKRGYLIVLVTCCLFQHPSLALLPRLSCRGIGNDNLKRPTKLRILHSAASDYEDREEDAKSELDKTLLKVQDQQQKIDMLLEALESKNKDGKLADFDSSHVEPKAYPAATGQKEVQVTSAPLKVMLFIDGTWLYYSLHERDDQSDPIVQRYGKGWQFKYNVDWGALPRVICKALQEQDMNQGWSTIIPGHETFGRPIEVVRVLVYTSYKANTPKHSFRYQMFQEMLNARYDVHMMETVGAGEKCIDIQLAVDMLHYATEPNAYDIAVLLSGDKDYMPAMVRTRQKGRRVGLVSMRRACNRALRESSNIKDYDVIFLEDHLDEIFKLKTESETHKRTPNVSQFILMKVISDFVKMSGMPRINSRDIGTYMKPLMVGNRRLLEEMKQTYGGLYQFLIVSGIFMVEKGTEDKAFWVALRENADFILKEELQKRTQFTASENKFFEEYSLDSLESDKGKSYWHSSPDSNGSLTIGMKSNAIGIPLPQELLPDFSTFTVAKLKEVCRERSLPVSGKKDELIKRIEDAIEAEKEKPQPVALEEMEPSDYLHGLILEYLQVKGGQGSSRDVGRYLAANKASPKRLLTEDGRIAALTELKELSGSLHKFVVQSDTFDVKDIEDGDAFEFLISLK
jgi:hypothetical protein